jgi:hypothetical protein
MMRQNLRVHISSSPQGLANSTAVLDGWVPFDGGVKSPIVPLKVNGSEAERGSSGDISPADEDSFRAFIIAMPAIFPSL